MLMFFYTKHALEKMDGLGIIKSEVQNTIIKGMKWKEENTDKWHARMSGIEIVFMKNNQDFIIVTTYLSRRKK